MAIDTAQTATLGRVPVPPGAAVQSDAGLLGNAQALWHDLRGLAHDHIELAALETQRAGKSLVDMLVYAVAAAILLVSAWLGLMGALAFWLAARGLNAGLALLVVAALNTGAAWVLFVMIRRSSQYLRFPATMRSLQAGAAMVAQQGTP
jgi:uncharacterized membrane protein YqjE